MGGYPFWFRSGVGEQTRGTRMASVSFDRRERVVDRRTDERVNEAERLGGAQDVDPGESGSHLGSGQLVQLGQRRGVSRVGVAAEDRDRLRQARRFRCEARKSHGDGSRAGLRTELPQPVHVGCGRGQALCGDSSYELTQEQRVATRLVAAGGAEGIVGIRRQVVAHEPAGGHRTQASRANNYRQGIGDDLVEEGGFFAL